MSENDMIQEFYSEGDGSGPLVSTQPMTNTPKDGLRLTTTIIKPSFDFSPITEINWSPLKSPSSFRPSLYSLLKPTEEKKPKSAKKLFLFEKFFHRSSDEDKPEQLELPKDQALNEEAPFEPEFLNKKKQTQSRLKLLKEEAIKKSHAPRDLSQYKGSVINFYTGQEEDHSFIKLFDKYAQIKLHPNEFLSKPGTKLAKLKNLLKSEMLTKRKERHYREEKDYKVYEEEKFEMYQKDEEENFFDDNENYLSEKDVNEISEESVKDCNGSENDDIEVYVEDDILVDKLKEQENGNYKDGKNNGDDDNDDDDDGFENEDPNLDSDDNENADDDNEENDFLSENLDIKDNEADDLKKDLTDESEDDMPIMIKKLKKKKDNAQLIYEEADEPENDCYEETENNISEDDCDDEKITSDAYDHKKEDDKKKNISTKVKKIYNKNTVIFENESETNKMNKYKCEFIEEEAELSGSEASSDEEEDNEDDNALSSDLLNDEEIASNDELRNEIGKVFQKQVLDEDKRLLLQYQERYLEDGDLYLDGKKREKRFRWKNADYVWLNDARNSDTSEDDKSDEDSQEVESAEISFKLKQNATFSNFKVNFN